ncbi:MAG: alkaline phosphatase family protein [Acidobacteriota bacterium]|nr:alkaline phosphatase family protein [Blastocatellia bacterium]MDW8239705.1 alkaline phosphatase family protein [Acidobacteriota bacterium]
MGRKLLIIGLDGASFVALDPLMQRGAMPTLARLRAEGFSSILLSTLPPVSAPAWSTFITGKNPGKHGVFQFYDVNPWSAHSLGRGQPTYLAVPGVVVNARSITEPKLWDLLGAAGRRVACINLPISYPPEPINGVMITGMLTPPGSRHFTHPPELAAELTHYEIDLHPQEKDFSSPDDHFLQRMQDILRKRARTALELFQREPWDCFIVVFTETDRLQHRYWHHLDPSCQSDHAPELQHRLITIYQELDHYLNEFVRLAGADYDIIILSDHGFGPAAQQRLNFSALARELQLQIASNGLNSAMVRALQRLLPTKRRIYKYLGPITPAGLLERTEARLRDAARRTIKAKLVKLHDYIGGIWINTADHHTGVIEPGTAYDAFRAELIEKLTAMRDPHSGRRLISEIMVREGVYRGHHAANAPDIIFNLDDQYGIDTDTKSAELICQTRQKNQGTHRAEGILIMNGNAIRPGAQISPNGLSGPLPKLEDVTATILYLAGVPLLEDMDGHVIEQAIDPDYLQAYRVHIQSARAPAMSGQPYGWNTDEEEKLIRERLKELGYLE